MESQKLWKIVVEAQLEIDEIERAVAQVPELTEPTAAVRGVELQRIDILDARTVVFVTGSDESIRAMERCCKVFGRSATVQCTEATAKELYASEPPNS